MQERATDWFTICESCRSICCKDAKPPITAKRREIIRKAWLKDQKDEILSQREVQEFVRGRIRQRRFGP